MSLIAKISNNFTTPTLRLFLFQHFSMKTSKSPYSMVAPLSASALILVGSAFRPMIEKALVAVPLSIVVKFNFLSGSNWFKLLPNPFFFLYLLFLRGSSLSRVNNHGKKICTSKQKNDILYLINLKKWYIMSKKSYIISFYIA